MRGLFWNEDESRLRTLWRILGQLLLMILIMFLIGALLGEGLRATLLGQGIITLLGIGGSVLLAARWFDHRPVDDLGLRLNRTWFVDCLFGTLLGIFLMGLIFVVQLVFGWIEITDTFEGGSTDFLPGFLSGLVLFVCVGISEELWVRGYLIPNLSEGFRSSWMPARRAVITALVLTSVIFGLLHIPNPNANVYSTTEIVLAGLVLGLPFVLTGSLAIPIGLHFTWNAAQGLLFGFPVSGIENFPSIVNIEETGPDAWTGGPFGPEAGLIGACALLLGALIIYAWIARRSGTPAIQEAIALPPFDWRNEEMAIDAARDVEA